MSAAGTRLERGGRIDRGKPLNFVFNGRHYVGYSGDTLASALIANGVTITAGSFRYRRPRGIFSAGIEECHALVTVGSGNTTTPNVRATRQALYEGLFAASQGDWPSLRFSLSTLPGWLSRFLPTGFYYKTFQWPHWRWYEPMIRRMAGIATAPTDKDPDRYDNQHTHCDLLIIGGGPAGLAAADVAASAGLRILLLDDQPDFGGSLLWDKAYVDDQPGADWARLVTERLDRSENVKLLQQTTAVAAWDHGLFTAIQDLDPKAGGQARQRLWKIRSRRTILATGAIERPLVFPDNDRPGIMLADSARQYVNRYAVKPGESAVVFTNNDSAYRAAEDLYAAGVSLKAVVDTRKDVPNRLRLRLRDLGITLYRGYEVAATRGYFRLRRIDLQPISDSPRRNTGRIRLTADLLCVSGGWNPTLHLFSQAGGVLQYDKNRCCFVPTAHQTGADSSIAVAGSANGTFGLTASLAEGHAAGRETIPVSGAGSTPDVVPPAADDTARSDGIAPYWYKAPLDRGRQWVDHLHDVCSRDIATAVREGFSAVEHLKRYTTVGMSCDQGKTANVNALAILAEATAREISDVGTTTFRPPYKPVPLGALAGRETGPRAWPIRRLPAHEWHIEAGGIMEIHSGWLRAACYPQPGESEDQAIRREVLSARNGVALFDGSSLGKLEVSGPDAAEFLNRMYINNVKTLQTGRVRYGMMLRENGIIADDGVFARLADESFLVSSSSAGTAEVLLAFEEWLQTEWPELDVLVHNASTQWATLTVSGPKSRNVVGSVLPNAQLDDESFAHMSVQQGEAGTVPYRLMRVSFTGERSYELSVPAGRALSVWRHLILAGAPFDITPIGMEALDVLRTEKGFLEVGVDTDVSTSPLDVGWSAAIARKAADFVGKRSLALPEFTRSDRLQLVGLQPCDEQQFLPVGSHIVSRSDGAPEGHVTSSCLSPTLQRSIAMALLKSGHTRHGDRVTIDVDAKLYTAEVVSPGFYDPQGERLG